MIQEGHVLIWLKALSQHLPQKKHKDCRQAGVMIKTEPVTSGIEVKSVTACTILLCHYCMVTHYQHSCKHKVILVESNQGGCKTLRGGQGTSFCGLNINFCVCRCLQVTKLCAEERFKFDCYHCKCMKPLKSQPQNTLHQINNSDTDVCCIWSP